ncbi:hypothetical protein L596_020091 [Steinernema carpocapsae]|uniref:Tyr recombinase domain-containing protein n=1 Tax=Steinernema carpocapsae TaxID=34508 RepID=A0A4U5MSQ2_STECR|nr:hypothetical protein L596_020091 [Steinernema carpocapsae]
MTTYARFVKKFQDNRVLPPTAPTSDQEVVAYLSRLYEASSSATTVQSSASALKWYFSFWHGPNPCASPWVSAFLEGVRRTKPATVHRAKISQAELRLVLRSNQQRMRQRRVRAYVGLLYAACLRPAEGLHLTREDITFNSDGMIVSIAKDKTNKKGSPRSIPVLGGTSPVCPVQVLKEWLQIAPDSPFVFPKFSDPKNPMSYDSARDDWKKLASILGISKMISLHSFRGGAATQAIKDGAPLDEVMRFGRWRQH